MSNVTIKGEVVGEFVSRKGGWVTYISTDGSTKTARGKDLKVEGEDAPKQAQEAKVSKAKKAPKGKTKATAKARKAKSGEPAVRKCGEAVFDMARYIKHKTPAGTNSYDNGDKVATTLRDKTLDEVYQIVARELKSSGEAETIGEAEKALRSRYSKLNVGMQRMNLGNKLRALVA